MGLHPRVQWRRRRLQQKLRKPPRCPCRDCISRSEKRTEERERSFAGTVSRETKAKSSSSAPRSGSEPRQFYSKTPCSFGCFCRGSRRSFPCGSSLDAVVGSRKPCSETTGNRALWDPHAQWKSSLNPEEQGTQTRTKNEQHPPYRRMTLQMFLSSQKSCMFMDIHVFPFSPKHVKKCVIVSHSRSSWREVSPCV